MQKYALTLSRLIFLTCSESREGFEKGLNIQPKLGRNILVCDCMTHQFAMVVINKRETLQTFKFEKTGKVGIKELHFFRLALYDDNNVLHIRRRLVEKKIRSSFWDSN